MKTALQIALFSLTVAVLLNAPKSHADDDNCTPMATASSADDCDAKRTSYNEKNGTDYSYGFYVPWHKTNNCEFCK